MLDAGTRWVGPVVINQRPSWWSPATKSRGEGVLRVGIGVWEQIPIGVEDSLQDGWSKSTTATVSLHWRLHSMRPSPRSNDGVRVGGMAC